MSPLPAGNDFLDDALKNRTQLPSWRSIFTRLSSTDEPSPTTIARITAFLSSSYAVNTLTNCHQALAAPSTSSKDEFEKRTAPINFTAADQPNCDGSSSSPCALPTVGELKTDALDFSKVLNINEVDALRVVILEHQSRPSKALLAAQPGAGGDSDFGPSGFEASFLESIFQPTDMDDQKQKDDRKFFDRVEVYLSERRYVLKVAAALARAVVCNPGVRNSSWKNELGATFMSADNSCAGGEWTTLLLKVTDGIQSRWNGTNLPGWITARIEEPDVHAQAAYIWEKQILLEITHLLQLLFVLLYRPPESVNAELATKWFNLMGSSLFLSEVARPSATPSTATEIQNLWNYITGLASIVSLTMIQVPAVNAKMRARFNTPSSLASSATPSATGSASPPIPAFRASPQDLYILDPAAVKTVNSCLQECALECPGSSLAVMGWICVLHGIWKLVDANTVWGDEGAASQASDVVEFYRSLLPELFPTSVEAGLKNMASTSAGTMLDITTVLLEPSEGASSFDLRGQEDGSSMRNVLANLLQNTIEFFDISVGLIVATFLVTDVEYNELGAFNEFLAQENVGQENCCPEWIGSPVGNLLRDPNARNLLVRVKNRFPYEPLPLLQLLRGFSTESSDIIGFLSCVDTYTQQLPYGFRDYDDIGEEDAGQIELASDLVLFPPREDGLFELGHHTANFSSLGGIAVREGTRGVQASGAGAKQVVTWQCDYNALSFFGRILECALLPDHDAVKRDLCTPGVVTEVVVLLTGLIASSKEAKAARARMPGHYEVPRVLEEASDMLGRNRDIVSVVFDLLDKALNHYAAPNPLFAAGLEFVDSLVYVVPGRVWPYLARSTLLERRGHGGAFSGIISAVEVVQGSYEVTLAALTLFESLVDEAIRGSAVHKGRSKGLVVPSKAPPPATGTAGSGVSDNVQRDILLGFTRVIVDIFESYRGFKYTRDISQKLRIGIKIAKIFTTILNDVYGIDEFSEAEAKITSVLGPSAEYLISVFLGEGTSELSLEPIVGAISDGISTPETSLYLKNLASWLEQVVHIVKFADLLVRVRLYIGLPFSQLEKHLYAASASISKLYAADDKYKQPVLELFESLVKSSQSLSEEPPSLLGHLGRDCANHFVTLLSALDMPYQDEGVETRIWNFVSAVVSNKQQGMSILLLRGEALRQRNIVGKGKTSTRSMLSIAFDALEEIDRLPVEKTLAMLEMISTAQNFWTLAQDDIGKHPKFLSTLTKHVESLTIEFLPADSKEIIREKAYKVAIAATIARILALYLWSRRASAQDETFFKQLQPRLNFYFENAVKINGYRPSLHMHLQKNFEEKWPGLKLLQLKKTRLRRTEYGSDAVYDMDLGDKVLGFDPGWGGRPDGYKHEVEQANLNLSLVQTQVDLLSAWELLAVELCAFVKNSKDLAESLVGVAESCLSENIETGLPAPIFAQIIARRAEFAFVIVRKLHQALPESDLFKRVFMVALRAVHNDTAEFRLALSTANMDYHRSLLRILYISLLATSRDSEQNSEFALFVLSILDLVVAKGFKDLVQAAHQHRDRANPQDIALITGILQAALRLKGIDHHRLADHLQDSQTIRSATTLFSWAENLAEGTENPDDPMYGELSVLFLLELSSVPVIAEQLAIENILERITSTTLAARIARTGVVPMTHPRLHSIWARGLLPLALNLLANMGTRYGREILAFLKFFRPQILTAILGWKKPAVVVLPAVNEMVGIGMMLALVAKMGGKQELAAFGIDTTVAVEGVDYLLTHRNYLKSLVTATSAVEEEMLREKPGDDGEVELVERVVNGLITIQGLLQDDGEE